MAGTTWRPSVRRMPGALARTASFWVAVALVLGLAACAARAPAARPADASPAATAAQGSRPVVIQGAMDLEVLALVARLEGARLETIGGWKFWHGTLDGYPVVISKTMKGLANAAAATALAAERYRPAAIVNQGTSGGHDPRLRVYDIVVGTSAVSLSAFKTPFRKPGEGSSSLEWTPLDLLATEGSAGEDPNEHKVRRFDGDAALLSAARSVTHLYRQGQVVEGVIASADVWNSELDRIERFRRDHGTTAEEMEAAAAAQVSGFFGIPFLGIRVLSNNITNAGAYDAKTGEACQTYVYEVVRAYIGSTLRR